jgi:hypothetical protein
VQKHLATSSAISGPSITLSANRLGPTSQHSWVACIILWVAALVRGGEGSNVGLDQAAVGWTTGRDGIPPRPVGIRVSAFGLALTMPTLPYWVFQGSRHVWTLGFGTLASLLVAPPPTRVICRPSRLSGSIQQACEVTPSRLWPASQSLCLLAEMCSRISCGLTA